MLEKRDSGAGPLPTGDGRASSAALPSAELARRCRLFMQGTKRLYDGDRLKGVKGDMWFFELWHHLNDCAEALERFEYQPRDDFSKSVDAAYEAVKERVAAGGPGWSPKS